MSTRLKTATTFLHQYEAQVAAEIDVQWAKEQIKFWQGVVDAETAREAEAQLDAALAARSPSETATTAVSTTVAAGEPRSHLSRLEQLERMEAENSPGQLMYDLEQAQRRIIARSPHLAQNPTALRSIAVAELKVNEVWASARKAEADAEPDYRSMSLAELREAAHAGEVSPAEYRAGLDARNQAAEERMMNAHLASSSLGRAISGLKG